MTVRELGDNRKPKTYDELKVECGRLHQKNHNRRRSLKQLNGALIRKNYEILLLEEALFNANETLRIQLAKLRV